MLVAAFGAALVVVACNMQSSPYLGFLAFAVIFIVFFVALFYFGIMGP